MSVKYPNIKVQLVGKDGNAFSIIGRVTGALRKAGVDRAVVTEFTEKCFAMPSYNALLAYVAQTVVVS